MVECQKCLDPTSLGLFLVAVVSLPLAIVNLLNNGSTVDPDLFTVLGIFIIIVALLAYKADSNFGFVVFGLVGAAVLMTGLGMGAWECIAFGIVFLLAIIWSVVAHTPKLLSCILVTTSLIFLTVGLSVIVGGSYWPMVIGIVAGFNFLFTVYLAFALALEDKIPFV
jgi:hypothetical protein